MNHPDERDQHAHPGTSVPQVDHGSEPGMPQRAAESSADEPASAPPQIDRRLLELLVCPLTKQTLDYDAAAQELISRAARLAFPIRDGIPIMLPEEARPLLDEPGR
jgi:uncharacterized protein YbaR (Trm112 family)